VLNVKRTMTKLKLQTKPTHPSSSVRNVHISVHSEVHNAAENTNENVPSHTPNNHHSSDAVYWMAMN